MFPYNVTRTNGWLARRPSDRFWQPPNDGGAVDPPIPNLPFEDRTFVAPAHDPQINFRCGSAVDWGTRTNTTITAPPTISDGDLLLLFWERLQNGVTTPGGMTAPTPPSGFTLYDPASEGPILWQTDGANIVGIFCYYKRASGESGSYTVTHGSTDCEAYLAVFQNVVSSGSPFGAYGSRTASTSTTAGTAAGVTHTEINSRLCYLMLDFAGAGGLSPPTPMAEHRDAGIYFATQWQSAAAATGDRTQTTGDNTWATRMFELLVEPAAGATESPFTMAGVGAAAFVAIAEKLGAIGAAATGALGFVSQAIKEAVFGAAAQGTLAFVSQADALGAFSMSGAGTAAFVSEVAGSSAFSKAGGGLLAFVGQSIAEGAFSMSGAGAAAVASSADKLSAMTMAGVGAAAWGNGTSGGAAVDDGASRLDGQWHGRRL